MSGVDIIIPIYNAADDLEICLESIYKHTDLENNRLVLINDNSPDPRIKEILDAQSHNNVIVIHNEKNQGFSANINLGMKQSLDNDVLLLNSDTIVTRNWIEKIVRCAYSAEEIGTVTPLSNNATLCSVPVFCEENKLPVNINVDKMAEIVERCSMHKYPRISVAHGFCMFIKREVINKIGFFDAETFGRGYGEENDYCNRAEQMGYIHVQCDDTFILHTGTKSFVSAEKEAYIREHDRILRKRYPEQMHANDVYVSTNPNGYVQENIRIFMDIDNGKKNILYVLHSDFRKDASDNVGGTQLHVSHLKDQMIKDYNVFVAARDGSYLNLTVYTGDKEHFWKFYIGEYKGFFRFHDRELKNAWNLIMDAFNFCIIHVHHVYSLSFDVFDIAKERDIPVVLTCHDFFFVSPSLKMLDENYQIIRKESMTADKWKKTLNIWAGLYSETDYIDLWQQRCKEILLGCKKVIVPDATVKKYLSDYYSEISDQIIVIEHGYEFADRCNEGISSEHIKYHIEKKKKIKLGYIIEGWGALKNAQGVINRIYISITDGQNNYRIPTTTYSRLDVENKIGISAKGFRTLVPNHLLSSDIKIDLILESEGELYIKKCIDELHSIQTRKSELNIGFIGGIGKEKGASIICDIIKKAIPGVNYYIFGNLGDAELSAMQSDNLFKFDKYDSNDLPDLVSIYSIDVLSILSIWPETFSYTLSEALLCKKPVIVSDVGALGNRMRTLNAGWSVSLENACDEFEKIINEIKIDKNILEIKKKNIDQIKLRNLSEMASDYKKLYEQFTIDKNCGLYQFDSEKLFECYAYSMFTNSGYLRDSSNSKGLSAEDQVVLNSLSFKIARKIRKINFPFKQQLWFLLTRNRRV